MILALNEALLNGDCDCIAFQCNSLGIGTGLIRGKETD